MPSFVSDFFLCVCVCVCDFFLKQFVHLFLAVLGLGCCAGFSLVVASGGYSQVAMCGLLTVVASLVAKLLWCTGLAGPRQLVFSWIRHQTAVSCIGRWILSLWLSHQGSPSV